MKSLYNVDNSGYYQDSEDGKSNHSLEVLLGLVQLQLSSTQVNQT